MPPESEQILRMVTVWDVMTALAALGGVVGVVVAWVKIAHPVYAFAVAFRESWFGRPESRDASGTVTRPAEAGMVAQLGTVREVLDEHAAAIADIRHHVKPNSGTSAYDVQTRKLDAALAGIAELRDIVTKVALRQSSQGNELSDLRADYLAAISHNHPDYHPEA